MLNQRIVTWLLVLAGMGLANAGDASAQCNPRLNYRQRLDVNDDGIIAPLDLLVIINYLEGVDSGDFVDVNNDGNVTITDAMMVINYLSDPSGFPAYSSDGNPDSMYGLTFDTDDDGFVNSDDLNVIWGLLFVPIHLIPAGFHPDVNMDGQVNFADLFETNEARNCFSIFSP